MTAVEKTIENYERDKENFIIVRTSDVYYVTNLRTLKMYAVSQNNGKDECNWVFWGKQGKCYVQFS